MRGESFTVLKEFVDGQIVQRRDGSVSESMRELICADEKLKAKEQLEAKLLEGLNSPEHELGPTEWIDLRKEAMALLEAQGVPR
ncbi:MAG: type II toxin-antitoxin system ParD family antitoxin [Magnetococcales bacterium]|nr:type II toxin-antitoxin system ParD family antitoxin [Magnetococcales bacterium]